MENAFPERALSLAIAMGAELGSLVISPTDLDTFVATLAPYAAAAHFILAAATEQGVAGTYDFNRVAEQHARTHRGAFELGIVVEPAHLMQDLGELAYAWAVVPGGVCPPAFAEFLRQYTGYAPLAAPETK